jgi:hypothetical protein
VNAPQTRYYSYEDADGETVVGSVSSSQWGSVAIPEGARELSAAFYDKALERSQRALKARERAAEKAGALKDQERSVARAAALEELSALGLSENALRALGVS